MAEAKVQQALRLLVEAGHMDLIRAKVWPLARPARKSAGSVVAAVWACSPPRREKVCVLQEEAGPSGGYPGGRFVAPRRWEEEKAGPSAGSRMASPEVWSDGSMIKDTLWGRWDDRAVRPSVPPSWGSSVLAQQQEVWRSERHGTNGMMPVIVWWHVPLPDGAQLVRRKAQERPPTLAPGKGSCNDKLHMVFMAIEVKDEVTEHERRLVKGVYVVDAGVATDSEGLFPVIVPKSWWGFGRGSEQMHEVMAVYVSLEAGPGATGLFPVIVPKSWWGFGRGSEQMHGVMAVYVLLEAGAGMTVSPT
ncbi:hypothetical protein NDU88_001084 [Pleurodeles waltl]|uniref:Uncharacterized protein n=1 Tax=Pleurodeles waltl TaxID=8319 RepID=A0AAV7WKS4_PLEWA|nr:hypothetical protein NDU88_001084 [Pleurodeles waltl]